MNGRHEETRTPDLYRVKVAVQQPAIDSKGVNNRRNRQNRNIRRNLLPNCYQNMQVGLGLNRGGSAPFIVTQFTAPGDRWPPLRASLGTSLRGSTRPRSGQRLGQLLETQRILR